jgi:hypothetical protein
MAGKSTHNYHAVHTSEDEDNLEKGRGVQMWERDADREMS